MARVPRCLLTVAVVLATGCSKGSKTPTAPAGPGEVFVSGTPLGAMLSVDGTQVGVTPRRVEGLAAGSHTFSLAGFTGYADTAVVRGVAAGASDTLLINVRPLPGTPLQIETWDMPIAGGTQRDTPYAVDATYAGAVWVAGASGTIYHFDVGGTQVSHWTTSGMGGTGSIAASNDNVVYASSSGAAVGLYTTAGALVRFLSSMPTNVLDKWQPMPHPGLDEASTTGLFCCTADQYGTNVQVQRYDAVNGGYLDRWLLHVDATFIQPAARYAACTDAHHVFVGVVYGTESALDEYASDGTFIQRRSPFPSQGFDVDNAGSVYSLNGSMLTRTTLATGATYQWRLTGGAIQTIAAGLAVNPDGLFIADSANRRIIRYVIE